MDGPMLVTTKFATSSPASAPPKLGDHPVSGHPTMLVPDWAWAIILGASSSGWFLLRTGHAGSLPFLPPTTPLAPHVDAIVFVLLVLQAAPIAWASRRPVVAFLTVYVIFLATILIVGDRDLAMSATMLYAVLSLCAYAPIKASLWLLPLAVLVEAGLHALSLVSNGSPLIGADFSSYLTQLPLAYATPALAGLLFRVQLMRTRLEAERAAAVASATKARAAEAIDAERVRMAGEVHDIAAHHLSSVLLQTRAASELLPSESHEARALLDAAQTETEATLDDLRHLVAALRHRDSRESKGIAAPTLSDLPGLLMSVRTLYPDVDVTIDGDLAGLDPVRSLACFRIIQESLTNARKHAPGASVSLRLNRTSNMVRIEAVNGPANLPSPSTSVTEGYGLPGMRERTATLDGTLEHGPTTDGGWRILAVIPTRGVR